MDDSDDYILDDIVLDDQTLAVLDQEEQKYLHQSSHSQSSSTPPERPINKRHKTNSGWTAGIGASTLADDEDDLPDISLRADGSYGVTNRIMKSATTSRPVAAVQRSGQYTVPQKPINIVQPTPALPRNAKPRSVSRPIENPQQSALRQSEQLRKAGNQNQIDVTKHHELQTQVLELQKKLDELREGNTKVQAALKDAIDMKTAKEGEVSILRKTIEKNSQVHAAQVSQLRSEKERVDAKQVQLQNQMKEDMDRLRTQFLFKQQELEASIRVKAPASVRAKKTGRGDFPSTPLAVPNAMRGWNHVPESSTSRRSITETPSRAPGPPPFKVSPSKQLPKSPEKGRKNATLPGFQNAFDTSTPIRSPSRRAAKGTEKTEEVFDGEPFVDSQPPSQKVPVPSQLQFDPHRHIHQQTPAFDIPSSSITSIPGLSRTEDDSMEVVVADSEEEIMGEDEPFEPINWKIEMCRIILTHSHPSNEQITFQHLISSAQLVEDSSTYSASCSKVLAILATSAKGGDYEDSLQVISTSFLYILFALHESNQLLQLAVLLNLLTMLVLSLPVFQTTLLAARIPVHQKDAGSVIGGVFGVILRQLDPSVDHAHREILSNETLSFLESVLFGTSPSSLQMLELFVRSQEALMTLFHPSQPDWFLGRSSRMLAILSSHHTLCETLLGASNAIVQPDEPVKDPFLDRLCSHLIDSNRPPTDPVKVHILISFAQLSIARPSGHGVLVRSYTLIPSLILYTSYLTSPLWEDDEQLTSSPEQTLSLIQLINQTTCLLYHLIFDTNPCLNLRSKLQQAPHRPFNSINHIFIVTFGRLSYCDPPSWIDSKGRHELEYLADISRDILEVVVDGPEGDSVWAAFQPEPDEENAMDEEEMEARFMGIGV